MASSAVKLLFALIVFLSVGWIAFVFAAKLLTCFLSRKLRSSVEFHVAGCNCLRDVSVKFSKGSVESVCIGEIKLSLCKSLVNLWFSFISGDPKLNLLICDLEVVLRPPERSTIKSKSPSKPPRLRSSGKRKWILVTNVARFLSVSVTELVVKAPKAGIEIKDLSLDISKYGGPNPILNVKLNVNPLFVQICESHSSFDNAGFDQGECFLSGNTSSNFAEKDSTPFVFESLSLVCDLGHDREQGIGIKNLNLTSGDVTINLNENMFIKRKKKSEASVGADIKDSSTLDVTEAKKSENNKISSLLKKPIVPEKVSFNLPKLDVKFMHLGQDLSVQNNVMGIHLRYCKSTSDGDSGETATRFDVQMDFSEIHLLREGTNSMLEILKVAVIGSIDVPIQPLQPVRAEIDVKLGGMQCNLIVSRLEPWLGFHFSKKKNMVLHNETSRKERTQVGKTKTITWTCTVSAPEITIVLYGLNDLPLYHVCSQSSHLFTNNVASKGIHVHAELGEIRLHMADYYQESLRESLFPVEINSSSLMHIEGLILNFGHREVESHEEQGPNNWKLMFDVDVTGVGVCIGFHHVASVTSTLLSFKALLKSLVGSGKKAVKSKVARSSKVTSKGTQIVKLNIEKFSFNYWGHVIAADIVVADPKRVNYGSQGGETIITVSADGTQRTASVTSTAPNGCKKLKFSISLDTSNFKVCLNKEKRSVQIDLESVRSIFQEYSEDNKSGAKLTLFDMKKAKFVRRSGGLNEVSVCSLVKVTDIAVRWEPDFHLAVFEVMTSLKSVVHNARNQLSDNEDLSSQNRESEKEVMLEQEKSDKNCKKKEPVIALDVEMLTVSAELADGVEVAICVQSIFSENARIGVLIEEVMLNLNDTRLFTSNRMQISRIPVSVLSTSNDTKVQSVTTWDWVIQAPAVHIWLPYRLQLRAIDDAVEDTLRGLKLIAAAKTTLLFPMKKSSKKSKTKSTKFGSVRSIIRKFTIAMEEEPIQGWLDEHYNLMKSEISELSVRLRFLDEFVSIGKSGGSTPTEPHTERKFVHNGIEIDMSNTAAIKSLQDEIHKQAFQSYYQACQKLELSEGSGACLSGFQSGFKPSTNRASVLTISAVNLDLTLTSIEGGKAGMVEFINKMDPVSLDNEIPFSRTYGGDISLNAGSLTVQLRDYMYPVFSGTEGKCQGRLVLAQQATFFQPQIEQDVFIGKWWKVRMLRSASGTSPPMKTYMDLPLYFHRAEVSYGVGYEPVFADVSYVFTVALRRAILGTRGNNPMANQPPKKERNLPWWDDMRNYIHGKVGLHFTETKWILLGTTNPYEKFDNIQIITGCMEILQSDGHVSLCTKEFKAYVSSPESFVKNCSLKLPCCDSRPFLHVPAFSVDVTLEWECDSGSPLNHFLHALPREGKTRDKVLDPFRSTSLSLKWNISLRPFTSAKAEPLLSTSAEENALVDGSMHDASQSLVSTSSDSPTVNLRVHYLVWLFKWWNLVYLPPHKLRSFSRWPRFGVPRVVRSGNLALDKVMTQFFLRIEATPTCIKHMPLGDDDPASGLTFEIKKMKVELCHSRGKEKFTFESKRDPLDIVYQGVDLNMLKVYLDRSNAASITQDMKATKSSQTADKFNEKSQYISGCTEKCRDDGFLLDSDYFTIRKQSPKADGSKILAWQEDGRASAEMTRTKSELEMGSESDHLQSYLSDDDDGFNVVVADNCQRVFVYGLKLLWTIENRDAIWSLIAGISKAFQPPKPSPSRQYAKRKLLEEQQIAEEKLSHHDVSHDDAVNPSSSAFHATGSPSLRNVEPLGTHPIVSPSSKLEVLSTVAVDPGEIGDSEEEGTQHFMVNVIQPQFNLHSEEANGRFLLAAASGRILARSFHSVVHVGSEMIQQALGTGSVSISETEPGVTWKRAELSVMLEHVQAHVAPTDVDPGAGLQWLPKIHRSSPKVNRTGALLERVFMPCQMYFRYTRHKGGTPELKVKPLKELKFNSPNITATMTSRQFQVMMDVLSNLLFARLPKPRKSTSDDDDDDDAEEADEVVPDGVEEVELARISIEQKERERKLILNDIRTLSVSSDIPSETACSENDGELWMITGGKSILVNRLRKELGSIQTSRKAASSTLRLVLQKASQLRLMEKEKNKSPSFAMSISLRISKVVWSMLADGKSFAETEINNMIFDFDRDYKDMGVCLFTMTSFVVRNCLQNSKSDTVLAAWNAPSEWGKNVMLRVNAKQGAPKDGNSLLELLQVEIYPLKIHLAESMYRMMWGYFFPGEEQDSQKRQEVWKVSTNAGGKRVKKSTSGADTNASSNQLTREFEITKKSGSNSKASLISGTSSHSDSSQGLKLPKTKRNSVSSSNPEFQPTSSVDRSWEETVAESVADELVLQSFVAKGGPLSSAPENQQAANEDTVKSKTKDSKKVGKAQDENRDKSRKQTEFRNINISQVELQLTYEGSRFAVSDMRLLMDSFHPDDFTGTWRRLFSRIKKHIIWGVLKSVTGMQGKKVQSQNPKPEGVASRYCT
ncbi:protein SABRE-like isoform X2 [Asparagus officinalis]|uniref:protein SABRE-like isoform X2 n=1 Tax=Asparagus officinalis TaxID=4686 RepID=UPI00098E5B73|nr:protein SABRE-like isoform X2 [Asparagus officinalis]